MLNSALIFDMDGLLIDSEPLWCKAELEVFQDLGVPLELSMCSQTMGLRTDEVVSYWYARFPWKAPDQTVVAERIISRVSELVATCGQPLHGAVEAVQLCRRLQLPLALATSSPMRLVESVLHKLGLENAFDVVSSAQYEAFGKPHPAVYLHTAEKLGVTPQRCIAFEDSIRGIISAKAASMRCIAIPAPSDREDPRLAIADAKLDSLTQITESWLKHFISLSSFADRADPSPDQVSNGAEKVTPIKPIIPTKMGAAIWYGAGRENFRWEQVDLLEPNAEEVLIKVKKCFFSAMHVRAVLVGHAKHQPPEIFGRMFAGDVVAVGANVTNVKVGMRVTLNPERPCGQCYYCQVKEWGHCLNPTLLASGGMAEYVLVPAPLVDRIFELPPDITYAEGAYTETLACILQAMDLSNIGNSDIGNSDIVVILGDGGVGLTFVQLARLQGATKVIIAGKHDDALQQALALGSFRAVNIQHESLEAVVNQETQGYGADVIIEAVGNRQTYEQSMSLLRCGGTAVEFGGTPPGTKFTGDPNLIHYRSLKIHGSYRYKPEHFRRALELICTKQIDLSPIITHQVLSSNLTTDAVDIHQRSDCRALVIDFP